MKKLLLLSMMCLAALTMQAQNYVDLGLTSGTKWKTSNEKSDTSFFTYEEAVSQFGNRLPSIEQWEELKSECQWSWTGRGYKVMGPNGNYINLTCAGIHHCEGHVGYAGRLGYYWLSSFDEPDKSHPFWCIGYKSGSSHVSYSKKQCNGLSIRLVQNP